MDRRTYTLVRTITALRLVVVVVVVVVVVSGSSSLLVRTYARPAVRVKCVKRDRQTDRRSLD